MPQHVNMLFLYTGIDNWMGKYYFPILQMRLTEFHKD